MVGTRLSRLLRLIQLLEGDGRGAYARFAERVGLDRNHLNTLLTRLRKNPDAGFDAETAAKIEDATGARSAWLVLGRGDPFLSPARNALMQAEEPPADTEPAPKLPSRRSLPRRA